jgi:hypothetical protein
VRLIRSYNKVAQNELSTIRELERFNGLINKFRPEVMALIDMWAYERTRREQLLAQFDAMVADMDESDGDSDRVQLDQAGPVDDEPQS